MAEGKAKRDAGGGFPEPSPWVRRFAPLVESGGAVLDVACGSGRHTRLFLGLGHPVTALDIDLSRVADLATEPALELIAADLEGGDRWPLEGRRFAAVVVTNYLWRPLMPLLVAAVAPGGALIYETFARGNERYSHPRNPDFLLEPGELIAAVAGELTIVAYEHGITDLSEEVGGAPLERVTERICAVRKALARLP